MKRQILDGLNGANPLGFMAAVGMLRLLDRLSLPARLGFDESGSFAAWLECEPEIDLSGIIAQDAHDSTKDAQPWRLEYTKVEKRGVKRVADLKAPPGEFSIFLTRAIKEWADGKSEQADYAAAYATDVARDGNGNTKPTALHFTAANQQFLGTIDEIRGSVTRDWVERALGAPGQTRPGSNVRWDPDAGRSRALMSLDPQKLDTVVNAPVEWLAFRGLPAFPCVPSGTRVLTSCVAGRRQDELAFQWPLWAVGASYATVRSLLVSAADMIEPLPHPRVSDSARRRGVFAICTSEIRRSGQGFGNFGPASVRG